MKVQPNAQATAPPKAQPPRRRPWLLILAFLFITFISCKLILYATRAFGTQSSNVLPHVGFVVPLTLATAFYNRLRRFGGKLAPYATLLLSLLWTQISFNILWFVFDSYELERFLLSSVAIAMMAWILGRLSITAILILVVYNLGFAVDEVLNFHYLMKFADVALSLRSLCEYLTLCFFQTATAVVGVFVAIKKMPDRSEPLLPAFTLASGLAIILTIIGFAHLYYQLATVTDGKAFDYSAKSITIEKERQLAASFPGHRAATYQSIVEYYRAASEHPLRPTKYRDYVSGKTFSFAIGERIGLGWAEFYKERFDAAGITHFRITRSDIQSSLKSPIYNLDLYRIAAPPESESEYKPFPEISAFKGEVNPVEQYNITLPEAMTYHDAVELRSRAPVVAKDQIEMVVGPEFNLIWRVHVLTRDEGGMQPEIYGPYLLGIDAIPTYLQFSENFLDDSPTQAAEIMEVEFPTSFVDYLYFSVATFSTTGYGDIVALYPESRVLATAEIGVGWFLLAVFAYLCLAHLKGVIPDPPALRPSPSKSSH